MFVHPVKISVFIKPLKIKESSGGRSEDARGPLCCCGWAGGVSVSQWAVCVQLTHPIVRVCVVMTPESAGTRQWSAPGAWSSLITRPGRAGAGNEHKICSWARCSTERGLQCSGSGHESRRKRTHCEDLCGQA